jgi:hypothetical protein
MAKRKVFNITYKSAEEIAEIRGFERGMTKIFRKAIALLVSSTDMTDNQIANGLEVEESFVKAIRQELKTVSATN